MWYICLMATVKQKSTKYELKCITTMESLGYDCSRSSSSLGLWDVVAVNHNSVKLIQVKYTSKDFYNPHSDKELVKFKERIYLPGVIKELWVYFVGDRNSPRVYQLEHMPVRIER